MTLGQRIADLRKKINLSQSELSKRLSISKSSLAMYEIDERKPDYDTLQRIADMFNVSIDYLITGEEGKKQDDHLYKEMLDPDRDVFFKELLEAPEDRIAEMKKIWEILKGREERNKE